MVRRRGQFCRWTITWSMEAVAWMIVSLQILLSESTHQDFEDSSWIQPPAAPTLAWSSPYHSLVKGEQITLACSPPDGQKGENHVFYRINEKGQQYIYKKQNGSTLVISALRVAPKATFFCSYWGKNNAGRRSESQKSNQVEFSVIDPPPPPSLSPVPSEPVYLAGEKVTLWCSAPTVTLQGWRRYQFSQSAEDRSSAKSLDLHEDPSLVLTASREKEGRYACRYVERKYGRSIFSEWSYPVPILVRDPLPPPVLKVDHPSGAVGESKPLSIFCLSNESNNTKRFHFSRDGVEIKGPLRSSREPGDVTLNMSLAFLYAKHHQSGKFACRYEENINGRWIMSPWSQMLNIRVSSAPFAPSVGYAALGLLVPFLGVPLAFYWSRRKNASGCQQKSERKEKKEEAKLNDLGSERLEREDLQNSEVTYAFVSKVSAVTPLGLRTENDLRTTEGEQVMYSKLQLQATSRTA
ncbi:uncharacterized protein LOC112542641 [Python bivittatus]|uniref:Uncharacterized protein LOC112542641 n=1 Tax=Python bivittatus TaxID=176946 RepID=A0A9F5MZ72_PYTBI|nr:uncharacterized protein LOC112542641 [Python bivittatus]